MAAALRLMTSLLALGLCASQREVTMEKGPLYRVTGYPITIRCEVSGYQGPSEQNFQWSIYRPSDPQREIQIVSTLRHDFTYALYGARVQRGDIYIERLKGDSALLHITDLLDEDAGDYECHTPSTEERLFGSYSAKMTLFVIPDTLMAIMEPGTFRKLEGDPLELTCEVSKTTFQHTHVSLAWYLQLGDNSTEILSLSRDFVLMAGASYVQRLSSGDIRLDKIGDTVYKLSISKLQPSDQGQFYCQAVEWIQDPERTWKDIARKQSKRAVVTVTSIGRDFAVNMDAGKSSLVIGDPFHVTCSLKVQDLPARLFQVSWLLNNSEIAQLDPHGVPTLIKNEYELRERQGGLSVVRKSKEDYVLKIHHVGLSDEGLYHCEVSEMERTDTGFTVTQSKKSLDAFLSIKLLESNLKVSLSSSNPKITEGESLTFHCDARETSSTLSMSWYLTRGKLQREMIANMEQDGSLSVGSSYQQRHVYGLVVVEKMSRSTFALGIYNSLPSDEGRYTCQVTEWSSEAGGRWRKMNDQFQDTSVTVVPLSLGLTATLITRTPVVQVGSQFDLMCRVSATYSMDGVPTSITWQFLPSGMAGDYYQTLVQISHNGTIEWSKTYQHFQTRTMVTKSKLRIHRATKREMARYRCEVEVMKRDLGNRWITVATATSTSLMIEVKPQESSLQVSTENKYVEVSSGNAEVEIGCEVLAVSQADHQLAVAWYVQLPLDPGHALKILSAGYDGVVTYGQNFSSPRLRAKYQNDRVSQTLYQLRVLQTDNSDRGTYHCTVEEWMWSEDGWHKLGQKASGHTTLEFIAEDKLKVNRADSNITAKEGTDVQVNCSLESSAHSSSLFSVAWFHRKEESTVKPLLTIQHNSMVVYADGDEGTAERLQFNTPSPGSYSLKLRNIAMEDGGLYYCQIDEWRLGPNGVWSQEGSAFSGYTRLITLPPEYSVLGHVCSSPSLFNFILICPLLIFLLMSAALIYMCVKSRHRNKKEIQLKNGEGLWMAMTDPINPAKTDEKGKSEEEDEED
ncbi:immunoglobulin superfamily member 2 isoform X2 [Rhinatrema bivittatum]|uniref:immunoglobulin superfamily member 2 isoform X2 n=1 Tax=Rhinatrema bivittatum TaxID=194408 RepID=UPI00112EB7B5|nr:immunoglobulin superfamily member 2 isoform X2 [Rhinatrema bivittatum]